jgi:2-aminoethylphosphonate aminotransferase
LSSVIPEDKSVLIINNGAYGLRMQQICQSYGISSIEYNVEWGEPIDFSALESMLIEHQQGLSHIAFVHHETTVGLLNSIDKVSDLANRYNLETIVDAMSSFAGIPIDVKKQNLHYLVSSSNKCIQGMAGIGIVICKRDSLTRSREIRKRNYYFNLYENYRFFSERKEMQFTPPVQLVYALRQAINEYFLETEQGRADRYSDNYAVLIGGLEKLGFEFLVDKEHHSRILTAIVEPDDKNYSFPAMHDFLYERGFTIYPGKGGKRDTFRLANMGAIDSGDIKQFVHCLKQYMLESDITL